MGNHNRFDRGSPIVSCSTVSRRTPTDETSLYVYRGAALAEYSPLEYAVCVSIGVNEKTKGKKKNNKDSIRGRFASPELDFDEDHPLVKTHTQRLITKLRIPMVSEKPPPPPGRDDTDTSSERHRRFAE